ncbi:hypothetical protein AB0L88_08830 [Saccharopolyspora shandongensis]|uniref:hypothetical protein n=1 Tax=Saccharopolyspora shandongensis TaxID=418495 RepID=UPI00342A5E81
MAAQTTHGRLPADFRSLVARCPRRCGFTLAARRHEPHEPPGHFRGVGDMSEGASEEPGEDRFEVEPEDSDTDEQQSYDELELGGEANEPPDVFLDVPVLKVDEISLEVEDLRARVSLQAEVLDLLKLNVGVDAALGRVALEIKGVEAQALLKVRLDNVAAILDRVLKTIDRNPQILEHVTRGVESAAKGIGAGAGEAVKQVGRGAGEAVEEVGGGAGGAVKQVGRGAGEAVEDVGETVEEVGETTRGAVEQVGRTVDQAVEDVGEAVGDKDTSRPTKGGQRPRERAGGKARRGAQAGTPTERWASGGPRREPPKQPRPTGRDVNQ